MPNCERCLTYAAAGRDVLRLQEEYQVLGLQLEQIDLGQRSLREDRAALAQEAIAALDQALAAVQSPVGKFERNQTADDVFVRTHNYRHSMHGFLRRNTVNCVLHASQGISGGVSGSVCWGGLLRESAVSVRITSAATKSH